MHALHPYTLDVAEIIELLSFAPVAYRRELLKRLRRRHRERLGFQTRLVLMRPSLPESGVSSLRRKVG